jgi:hypothetical protein
LAALKRRYAAAHLEHGYALTGHAAQGATFERAFVLLDDQGALQEWGYVACSRARMETRLYLTDVARERETRAAERLSRAEAKLDHLGWRGRGKRGAELRAEMSLQRAALRLADQQHAAPTPIPNNRRDRERVELACDRAQRSLSRRPPERSHALARGRSVGTER